MTKVNVHELKARLSHFLRLLQNGEKVILMKRNIELGALSLQPPTKKRELGLARKMYPDFEWDLSAIEEPAMSDEEIEGFENAPVFPEE